LGSPGAPSDPLGTQREGRNRDLVEEPSGIGGWLQSGCPMERRRRRRTKAHGKAPSPRSSGDPEMNYPTSALSALLNGISILAASGKPEPGLGRQTGCLAGGEPGSRCLWGPPSRGIPPLCTDQAPRRDAAAPGRKPAPRHGKWGWDPSYCCSQMWAKQGPHQLLCKAGRSSGTALGGFASRGDCCLSLWRSSPGACPMGQLEGTFDLLLLALVRTERGPSRGRSIISLGEGGLAEKAGNGSLPK